MATYTIDGYTAEGEMVGHGCDGAAVAAVKLSPARRLERVVRRLEVAVYRRPSYAPTASRRLRQACYAHDRLPGRCVAAVLLWNTRLRQGQWIIPGGGIER